MTDSDKHRQKTAEALVARRVQIDPEYKILAAFSRAKGVNYRTLQRIESGRPHRFTQGTLFELDQAYQYASGTIRRMLDGEAPPTDPPAGPAMVPSGGVAPDQTGEPVLRIVGDPPLEAGEEVTVWDDGRGRRSYRFIKYVAHGGDAPRPVTVETDYPGSVGLEQVVRRLRHSAAGAHM